MKIKNVLIATSLLMASITGATAATTLTAWTFDNLPIAANGSPATSTGLGSASALGMGNSYNNTNSISNPDVQSLAGSSSGGPNSWRIRGKGAAPFGGNGWSTNAPIGTQGSQFAGSTFGFYQVKVSFDVNATSDAEANLLVQYTTDGSAWFNANIASVGTGALITTNTSSGNTVMGSYVQLASGWNNQITVDLSGVSGVDNNPNFAIRMVNASTGADCVNTSGGVYNNTSGNWTFDNVVIQGTSVDTIADWTFDNYPSTATIIFNPLTVIGDGTAYSIGFDNNYVYSGGKVGSTNGPDVTNTGGSSSGATGPNAWRVRGNPGNNGWNTAAPIGTQGAEYDVSTSGYTNIICTFDLYFTSAGEAKMCVLYTTDGWLTTNVAQTLYSGSNPGFVQTNLPVGLGGSPNTVTGTYIFQNHGQGFYNNFVVDFTGISEVDNNPNFGIRIVNAAKSGDCVAFDGGSYNNSSGNWRYDNIVIGGTSGTPAPALAFDPNATVDGPFTNTFSDNPAWRGKIAAVYVNGLPLTNSAYTTNTPGMIIFTPSQSTLLQTSGDKNISIIAAGFGTAKITQPLAAGVATKLAFTTQAAGPAASGGTLIANPVLGVLDQYNNGTTNPYPNVTVTAAVGGGGGWTLGGDTIQSAVSGIMIFTNLTATVNGSTAVSNAIITFTLAGYAPVSVTNSTAFNIGAPSVNFTPGNLAVLQLDTVANNTTFSLIEIKPASAGQITPVNIVPISATGTNGLRLSSSGSCGKLSLSGDGTLVCFAAFLDGSSATADETFNYSRAGAGVGYSGLLNMGLSYTSISPNGSQARSAFILDNSSDWIVDDKGGLYQGNTNSGTIANPNLNPYNNIVVRTFGGVPYVETQKTVNGQIIPVIYALGYDNDTGLYDVTKANNLATDPVATDFYLVSTNGGTNYDILYILDGISATQGVIKKYSWVAGADPSNPNGGYGWAANGSYTNSNGGDSLFATPNGNGGAYLYFTTGASSKNSLVRVTDATGYNASISVSASSSNVIYTAPGSTYVKGITFVPQQTANVTQLIPPPVLKAQNGAVVSSPFAVTNSPDVPAWRSAITAITVNGSLLPSTAYDTTQTGKIIFYPAQSTLLQGSGVKNIVVAATGYSDDTVAQTLTGVPQPVLGEVSLNGGGSLQFTFTSATGLTFSVLGTNNIVAAISTWPLIGPAVESPAGSGHYQFTAPNLATNSTLFYILRQP